MFTWLTWQSTVYDADHADEAPCVQGPWSPQGTQHWSNGALDWAFSEHSVDRGSAEMCCYRMFMRGAGGNLSGLDFLGPEWSVYMCGEDWETGWPINPHAAGANFSNTKWCKKHDKWPKPWLMGTQLRVLSQSFLMNTNMTGFRWFFKNCCVVVLCTKVSSAFEGLILAAAKSSRTIWWNLSAEA